MKILVSLNVLASVWKVNAHKIIVNAFIINNNVMINVHVKVARIHRIIKNLLIIIKLNVFKKTMVVNVSNLNVKKHIVNVLEKDKTVIIFVNVKVIIIYIYIYIISIDCLN